MNKRKYNYKNGKEKLIIGELCNRIKADLRDNLVDMKLFGSRARGDAGDASDIDVLIVLRKRDFGTCDKIYELLFDLDPYYEYKISFSIFSQEEYRKNEQLGSFFIENINKEALAL